MHIPRPIVWSDFGFRCRQCQRWARIAQQTLEEFNAVDSLLTDELGPTLAETAAEFEFCTECSHGEVLPGQYYEDIVEG